MTRQALAVLVLVGSASCYDPRVRAGLNCGPHGECPGQQRCVADICGGELPDAGDIDADLGPYELTVNLTGLTGPTGAAVRSNLEGIDCGTSCEHSYPPGTQVMLRVDLENGSNLRFKGWRGACAGLDTECLLSMDGDRVVTAEFVAVTHNLVFVTRNSYNLRVLGQGAFDNNCNGAASAAGLNNTSNDGFRAWVSDEQTTAINDLAGARGWVRMDGLPVFDALTDIDAGRIFNPISIDEGGREVLAQVVTGTHADASAGDHCSGWTGGGLVTLGQSTGGPTTWTDHATPSCSTVLRAPIYCFQRTQNLALVLPPPPVGSKRLFVTRGSFTPGLGGLDRADALCAAESPTDSSAPFRALLSRDGQPAGNLLAATTAYSSMSGQLIASGRELLDGARLHTGIWQHGDGGFLFAPTVAERQVRTGSTRPSLVSGDCGNWSSTSGATTNGLASEIVGWWATVFSQPCADAMRLYCVEQ